MSGQRFSSPWPSRQSTALRRSQALKCAEHPRKLSPATLCGSLNRNTICSGQDAAHAISEPPSCKTLTCLCKPLRVWMSLQLYRLYPAPLERAPWLPESTRLHRAARFCAAQSKSACMLCRCICIASSLQKQRAGLNICCRRTHAAKFIDHSAANRRHLVL